MLTRFEDGKVTLQIEPHQVKRFEEFLQLEVRKTRLFQSEREKALIEKHEKLKGLLLRINSISSGALKTYDNEPINETLFELAGALYNLNKTLSEEWELPEGDENADE